MKWVPNTTVLHKIDETQKAGNGVDKRIIDISKTSKAVFFSFILRDIESFLSLIWHEINESRILTPNGLPRTLKDVAQRIMDKYQTFEILANNLNLPNNQHDPTWFKSCVLIDTQFDYKRFGWITVVSATDHERKQSPYGTFYIFDGCHKTLVLSKLLLCNEIKYRPVEALLLILRPE